MEDCSPLLSPQSRHHPLCPAHCGSLPLGSLFPPSHLQSTTLYIAATAIFVKGNESFPHFPTSHHPYYYQPVLNYHVRGAELWKELPNWSSLQSNGESAPFQILNWIVPLLGSEPSSGFPSDSERTHMTQNNVRVNVQWHTRTSYPSQSHNPFHWLFFFSMCSPRLIPSLLSSANSNFPFSERSSLTTVF